MSTDEELDSEEETEEQEEEIVSEKKAYGKSSAAIVGDMEREKANKTGKYRRQQCTKHVRNCSSLKEVCTCGFDYIKAIHEGEIPESTRKCPHCDLDRRCLHHFKKDEMVCPKCGKTRENCGNWAVYGYDVCRMHGGGGGKPMESVEIKPTANKELNIRKEKIQSFELNLESELENTLAAVDRVMELADDGDMDQLMPTVRLSIDKWKAITAYQTILYNKKVVEKIPADIDKKIKHLMSETETRAIIAAMDNFIYALQQCGYEAQEIAQVRSYLPKTMNQSYDTELARIEEERLKTADSFDTVDAEFTVEEQG